MFKDIGKKTPVFNMFLMWKLLLRVLLYPELISNYILLIWECLYTIDQKLFLRVY